MKILSHTSISAVKSLIRMGAYLLMLAATQSPVIFLIFSALFLAELLGVFEEFFQ